MNGGVISYEVHERVQIRLGHMEQTVASLEAQLEVMRTEVERWKAIAREENEARIAEENTHG